jgi:NADPH-dependent 2,4-dienoyl-CoA reductase/sulfur reductase-like enzyme
MIFAEVLIVGAGPAGIAAATAARAYGRQVILLDDNAAPGGQIWRGTTTSSAEKPARGEDALRRQALDLLARSGAVVMSGYRVFDAPEPATLHAICEGGDGSFVESFRYEKLILATGARERLLPFPGWTLPGVYAVGGLQALVKGGFSVQGKRIVVAGTGPLLLAVAAHLKDAGATIVSIAEQAPLPRLAAFALSLASHPMKIWQGLEYRAALIRSPFRTGCWPVEAIANIDCTSLSAVRLTDGKRSWEEPCDLLACGFHLVPNTELAALLGCAMKDGFVTVDPRQHTSVSNVFCAGEPCGIAGLEAARIQGEIAGLAAAGLSAAAKPMGGLQRRAATERAFAAGLERAFVLRPELRSLPLPGTIVCRCEDVPMARLRDHAGWTDAKLQSRCGMGPCQGRVCGPAVEFLLGWKPASIRPPLFPVPLGALSFQGHDSKHDETLKEKL